MKKSALLYPAAALLAFVRYVPFLRESDAAGRDAYWYLIQIRSLLDTGHLHSPDPSPIYDLGALLALLTGRDWIAAFRILQGGLILITAMLLLSLAQVRLPPREGAGRGFPGRVSPLFALLAPASATLLLFGVQYPKQLLSFALLLAGLRFLRGGPRRSGAMFSLICFALSVWSHRSALVFLMAALAVPALSLLNRERAKRIARDIPLLWILAGFAVLSGVAGITGYMRAEDLSRVVRALGNRAYLAPLRYGEEYGVMAGAEAWSVLLVSFVAVAYRTNEFLKRRQETPLRFALLWTLLFWAVQLPLFRFHDLQIRLYLPLLLLALVSLPALLVASPETTRPKVAKFGFAPLFAILLLLYTLPNSPPFLNRALLTYPYRLYDMVIRRTTENLPRDAVLLVAHKGLAEYIKYTTGLDALPWRPEPEMERKTIFRLAYGIPVDAFRNLPDSPSSPGPVSLGGWYVLVREDLWESFEAETRKSGNETYLSAILNWKNPGEVRPAFLKR